jgi:hypothetical protein
MSTMAMIGTGLRATPIAIGSAFPMASPIDHVVRLARATRHAAMLTPTR